MRFAFKPIAGGCFGFGLSSKKYYIQATEFKYMKEFAKDIENLIEKHWRKLIVILLFIGFISNFKEVKKGFVEGYNSARVEP
jgi:hypothetical protein